MRRRRSEAKRANRMPCVTSWPESCVTLTLLYGVALFKQKMNTRYPLFVKWERIWRDGLTCISSDREYSAVAFSAPKNCNGTYITGR